MRGAGSVVIGAIGMVYAAGLVLWLVAHFWWVGLIAVAVYLIYRVAQSSMSTPESPERPNTSQAQHSDRR